MRNWNRPFEVAKIKFTNPLKVYVTNLIYDNKKLKWQTFKQQGDEKAINDSEMKISISNLSWYLWLVSNKKTIIIAHAKLF